MIKKKTIMMYGLIVFAILTIVGISYAYFTAQFTGGETSDTITVIGGKMNITYDGGPNINIANIIPSNNPAAIKTFTVNGNNTTPIPMGYKLSLVIESNDFSEQALEYKLISINTDNNGEIVPSINITNLGTGAKTIELGTAIFSVPTGGNKTHTYYLEIYFPNQDYEQNIDQEKTFKAHILIENYIPPKGPLLRDEILAQGGGVTEIENKGIPNFGSPSGTSVLYAAPDEYGTSYYYRGNKNTLNNSLIWGGFQWKIVRINGDGSIRLLYNGICPNNECTINSNGSSTQISKVIWNTNYNDAKYLGYMYGGANGVASNSREGAVLNETSPNIKTEIETWYQNNILGKTFESQVADNLFCNDRQLMSEVSGNSTGTGYGSSITFYAAYHRLGTNKIPTIKCAKKNDRFTADDTSIGNGALTYPVGLLTADEASMAGLIHGTGNSSNYLYTGEEWWLLSPCTNTVYASMYHVNNNGYLYDSAVNNSLAVRPVISLRNDVRVIGDGSIENPFIVI